MGVYIKSRVGTPVFDSDAVAFISAAGITNDIQKTAINFLVVYTKIIGVWTKISALYPFVGGTASSHKWNLKTPLDTDAAFRLNFVGGWTHSSLGVQANGTTGYADTFFIPSAHLTANTGMMGVYTSTATPSPGTAFGVVNSTVEGYALLIKFSGDNNCYWAVHDNLSQGLFANNNSLKGLWSIGVNAANTTQKVIYKDSTLITTIAKSTGAVPNSSMVFSARKISPSTITNYDNRQYSLFYIANSNLTATEMENFYNVIQAYQTLLNRQA
jgi:hypothetical protein